MRPFHDDASWRDMKANRPGEWPEAVAFDREVRRLPGVQDECYLHRSCVPFDPSDWCQP